MFERVLHLLFGRLPLAGLLSVGLLVPLAHAASPVGSSSCEVEARPGESPSDLVARLLPEEVGCKKNVTFLFALGQLLNSLKLYDQAVDRLESVLMQQPDHWPAQLEYAIALDGAGERLSADALLAQLEEEPRLPVALLRTIRERRQLWQLAATESVTLWRHSLSLIGGHDNNLLGSTRLSQLDLTLPGGILPVTIDPGSQPRAGGFGRIDWRQDVRFLRSDGSYWNIGFAANFRHAPVHSDTDFNLFGLNLERVGPRQQGAYFLAALQNLNTQSGDIYQMAGLGSGIDLAADEGACRSRLGGEVQYRSYPRVSVLNGSYAGAMLQTQCVQSGWHARLRYGYERAEYGNRPGGDQIRAGFLVGKQTSIGAHRLNAEVDYEHQADQEGFSLLLENNLRRKINKTAYRLEYTYLNTIVEPIIGLEWLEQRSNLTLYKVDTRIVYAGLRWTW